MTAFRQQAAERPSWKTPRSMQSSEAEDQAPTAAAAWSSPPPRWRRRRSTAAVHRASFCVHFHPQIPPGFAGCGSPPDALESALGEFLAVRPLQREVKRGDSRSDEHASCSALAQKGQRRGRGPPSSFARRGNRLLLRRFHRRAAGLLGRCHEGRRARRGFVVRARLGLRALPRARLRWRRGRTSPTG